MILIWFIGCTKIRMNEKMAVSKQSTWLVKNLITSTIKTILAWNYLFQHLSKQIGILIVIKECVSDAAVRNQSNLLAGPG